MPPRHRPTRLRRIRPRARRAASRRRAARRPSGPHPPRAGARAHAAYSRLPEAASAAARRCLPRANAPAPGSGRTLLETGEAASDDGAEFVDLPLQFRELLQVPRGPPAPRARAWRPPVGAGTTATALLRSTHCGSAKKTRPAATSRNASAAASRPRRKPCERSSPATRAACGRPAPLRLDRGRWRIGRPEQWLAPRRHASRLARVPSQSSPAAGRATRRRSAGAAPARRARQRCTSASSCGGIAPRITGRAGGAVAASALSASG